MSDTVDNPRAAPLDRAAALAAFVLSDEGCAIRDPDALHGACIDRWPDIAADEIRRGIALARNTLRADGHGAVTPGSESGR